MKRLLLLIALLQGLPALAQMRPMPFAGVCAGRCSSREESASRRHGPAEGCRPIREASTSTACGASRVRGATARNGTNLVHPRLLVAGAL